MKEAIKGQLGFRPSRNQQKEIERLIWEVARRQACGPAELIAALQKELSRKKYSGRDKFLALKQLLVKWRFPLSAAKGAIENRQLFLPELKPPLAGNWQPQGKFKPVKLFIEKTVKRSRLAARLQQAFSRVETQTINSYSDYIKDNKFSLGEFKKPLVFITKENWDYIKPCPCTKGHLGCGYWIFNLGFGCPYDCSYCYLQHYTNFPGLILPANIDDFFAAFDKFHKKLTAPIRLGTGEFSDSLALDHLTGYSQQLIPYFQDKKVIFELKTKSNNIQNLLMLAPPDNIVISWSLSPARFARQEELGCASLPQRLQAAACLQEKGYRVGFHFDPIVHSAGWDKLYQETVEALYSYVQPPLAWISLGSLRCQRALKTIAEQRFPQSNIFLGELFLGEDKKLRYPKFIRREIYSQMLAWIRTHDKKTPVYLCMEDKETWQVVGSGFKSPAAVARYIV